jgi:hypothetical protein
MLLKVTHIDATGHLRKAWVTAISVDDALDQVDREWGLARVLSCMRISRRPVLRQVQPKRRQACG